MNPIKLIRKLGKLLRGGSTSKQIFLGVFLGFAAGMIPSLDLTLLLCIFLLLILNTNGCLAVPAYALGKILCLALAPVTFRMGYFMIHDVGLNITASTKGGFWTPGLPVIRKIREYF